MVAWGGGDISALPEFNDLSLLYLDYGTHPAARSARRVCASARGEGQAAWPAGFSELEKAGAMLLWGRSEGSVIRFDVRIKTSSHSPPIIAYVASQPMTSGLATRR